MKALILYDYNYTHDDFNETEVWAKEHNIETSIIAWSESRSKLLRDNINQIFEVDAVIMAGEWHDREYKEVYIRLAHILNKIILYHNPE